MCGACDLATAASRWWWRLLLLFLRSSRWKMCGLAGGMKKEKRLTRTSINPFSVSLSVSVSLFSLSSFFAGTTSRRCSLDHRGVAYWEQPSYARCIANEYRYLQQSVGAKSASCALLLFVTCHKLSLQSSRSPKLFPPVPPLPAPQTTTQVCKINCYHRRGKLKR